MTTQGSSQQQNKQIKVYTRLLFLRIGEVDTLFEKYQTYAQIESRWTVDIDELSSTLSTDDQNNLNNGKTVELKDYAKSNWHPKLHIENAIDVKEEVNYRAKKSKRDNQIYICEHRKVKGTFWEKLELNNFPTDVQDLSITLVSSLYDKKVILLPDPYRLSAVSSEAFVDQQEWHLYTHIDVEESFRPDLLFLTGDRGGDDDEPYENLQHGEVPQRSAITITCHAARRSKYFFWNGYFLIFLIALVSLCAFGVPPILPHMRLVIGTTLLLTEIAFRFTLTRSLPTVSYLTLLDAYGIATIAYLVIQCFYFAVIGTCMLIGTADGGEPRTIPYSHDDRVAFFIFVGLFFLLNLVFLLWLIFGPFSTRRHVAKKDEEYRMSISNQGGYQSSKNDGNFSQTSIPYSRIS